MELSCKSEYVLLALFELANHYHKGEPLQIRQIAAAQNIPERYLEQLLVSLKTGGLVKSTRGAKGGYVLAREPRKITLLDTLRCLEGLDTAASAKTPTLKTVERTVIQEIWQEAYQAANAVWQKYTLQDICEQFSARRQIELMYYI